MKRTFSIIISIMLLASVLTFSFNTQNVKASGTIYIRADGSIDPPTAPIQRDGDIYTLTGNINSDADGIVIERNNMTLDGTGYIVQGTGGGAGITLTGRSNITVKNTQIKAFVRGISLGYSSNNSIVGNNITNNDYGIYLLESSNNSVSDNNITNNNWWGIRLNSSSNNNSISGGNIANSYGGIRLEYSSNNTVCGSNITANNSGIYLYYSSNNNIISGNDITNNNWWGILPDSSSNNSVYHNDFINNTLQTHMTTGYTNVWDDGYPSGGNYWSDYTGIDQKSGSYQNETGIDGIGDTPYAIDANNTDHYPLMSPWPSGWKLDFTAPTNHPIVAFAVYNGSLYAAADNKLYVKSGSSWNAIDAPTFVTSLETVNVTHQQPAPVEWSGTYGGTDMDYAYDIIQTSDGGYALTGFTWSFGAGIHDFWLVKTDSSGNIQWNQTYGGTSEDIAYALVQTADGGYAIAGHTQSFGAGLLDAWLVKTDASGNMQWNQTYGGIHADRAFDLVQTIDGGYAMAGDTESYGSGIGEYYDFWLVKTDADGNAVWNRTYAGGTHDSAHSLIQTDDGGYALAGNAAYLGAGGTDFWLVRTDADGNVLWNKTYGGAYHDWADALIQTDDGGYAIGGTYSFGWGIYDFWLVKTDADGNMEWNQTYGGTSTIPPSSDQAYALVQTLDGGYALAGDTSIGAGYEFWLVKTDASGNAQWNQTYGGLYDDNARALVQTIDGGYALAGYTWSFGAGSHDFWLVKTKAFDPHPEKLVVGGQGGLYCYDGTLFSLTFSVPTYIKVLGAYNNRLYAGTMLDNPPTLYYCNGSADNPSDWYIDTDFSAILSFAGAFGSIDSFAVYDNVMYVGSGGKLYSFDGIDWSVAASYDDVYAFLAMKVYDDKLYLATRDQGWRKPLHLGGSGFSGRVIEFDGTSWTTVFDHDYWIYSLETYDNKLYVGTANKIYTFNGTDWETSFDAAEGAFYAISMTTYDGKVYVGMGNGYIFVDPVPPKTNPETVTVPEFPVASVLTVFMALTVLATALIKKKRTRAS